MLLEQRHQTILDYLIQKKSVTVSELSSQFFVSEATIRRDLTAMEKQGLLKRSHGGAVLFESNNDETSLLVREQKNVQEKQKIAQLALDFISSNSTVFMDSSSTTGMIIPFLKQYKFLTVITNGLKNALALSQHNAIKTYITGGFVNPQSTSAVGSDSIDYIKNMNAQVAFISCGGISCKNGVTDAAFEQARLKKAMLNHVKTKVLLCDS
ncbi:MAG: DeoR/GlpR family DNA-binding transcription regulator, partial [Oscillospiraceae bacterium]